MEAYRTIESKTIYNGLIFDVAQRIVELPNGRKARRDIVEHSGAAAVVAVNDNNELLMVRQYREGAKAMMLELPAGKLDPGEDTMECALREMDEETGYTAASAHFMTLIHVAAAYNTEQVHLYYVKGLKPGTPHPDTDEFVTVEWHPMPSVLRMIESGEITDMKTVIGVLMFMQFNYLGL